MNFHNITKFILVLLLGFLICGLIVIYIPTDYMEYNEHCMQKWSGFPFPVKNTVEQYNFVGTNGDTVFAECILIVERTFLWEFFILNGIIYTALIIAILLAVDYTKNLINKLNIL